MTLLSQGLVNLFLEFIGHLKKKWLAVSSRSKQECNKFGVEVAADVVSSLLDRTPRVVPNEELEGKLKLSRGAARIVVLVSAPKTHLRPTWYAMGAICLELWITIYRILY